MKAKKNSILLWLRQKTKRVEKTKRFVLIVILIPMLCIEIPYLFHTFLFSNYVLLNIVFKIMLFHNLFWVGIPHFYLFHKFSEYYLFRICSFLLSFAFYKFLLICIILFEENSVFLFILSLILLLTFQNIILFSIYWFYTFLSIRHILCVEIP